jgi:hypothetical protein
MTEYVLAYLLVGMIMVALAFSSPHARYAKLTGWTQAILTCVAFVLFWPALLIGGLVKRWRQHGHR